MGRPKEYRDGLIARGVRLALEIGFRATRVGTEGASDLVDQLSGTWLARRGARKTVQLELSGIPSQPTGVTAAEVASAESPFVS